MFEEVFPLIRPTVAKIDLPFIKFLFNLLKQQTRWPIILILFSSKDNYFYSDYIIVNLTSNLIIIY